MDKAEIDVSPVKLALSVVFGLGYEALANRAGDDIQALMQRLESAERSNKRLREDIGVACSIIQGQDREKRCTGALATLQAALNGEPK